MNRVILAILLGFMFGSLIAWGLYRHHQTTIEQTIAQINAGKHLERVTFSEWFIAGRMLASGGNPFMSKPGMVIAFAAMLAGIFATIGERYGHGKAAVVAFAILLFDLFTYGLHAFGFDSVESNVAWGGGALGGLVTILILAIWTALSSRSRRQAGGLVQ
jgi:hypothetical protein